VLFICIVLLGPLGLVAFLGIQQLIEVLSALPKELHQSSAIINQVANSFHNLLGTFNISLPVDQIQTRLVQWAGLGARFVLAQVGYGLSLAPGWILKSFLCVLTWVVFLVKGQSYRTIFLTLLIPWERERHLVGETFSNVLRSLVVANFLVSCIQASCLTVVFVLVGVPQYALLGMAAFFLCFVPVIGTLPVIIAAALWCYFGAHSTFLTVIVLIAGGVAGLLDNILRPFFMGSRSTLSFFWLFLSILGGLSLMGISGVVLGPVAFALFATVVSSFYRHPSVSPKNDV